MKKNTSILVVLVTLILTGCATKTPVKTSSTKPEIIKESLPKVSKKTKPIEKVIEPSSNVVMIDHKYFKIAYNVERRLAEYVSYELTADHLRNKEADRANKFISDPLLVEKKLPYVVTSEYTKTGYDRGHLAPSADFAWSQEANNLTFVMSNMAPQTPGLNRDAWKRLEAQVRKWACGEEKITVITGPVLAKNLPKLKSGLEIPEDFFKIIIDETPPKKAIAFLYHQTDKGDVLEERMVPMKNLETSTGVAFQEKFPELKSEKMRTPASLNEWKEADCN